MKSVYSQSRNGSWAGLRMGLVRPRTNGSRSRRSTYPRRRPRPRSSWTSPASWTNNQPSADIKYRVGAEEHTARWNNEAGLTPFTRISVFDADAVQLHVDTDLGYVYTPAELALFGHVAVGLHEVQQRIASEVSSLAGGSNPLLVKFARETKVYPLIETLGAATDVGELEAVAAVDDDAEATHERLTGEVHALRANALDALLTNAQQAERELRRLSGLLTTIKSFDASR